MEFILSLSKVNWVFRDPFCDNVRQILVGLALKKGPRLIWANAVKAILAEIWFGQNQRIFHDRKMGWMARLEVARLNTSSWCTLSMDFEDFSSSIDYDVILVFLYVLPCCFA